MSCDTPREIRLYGALGRKFGRVHRFAVANAAEAVRALSANFPGFAQHLREHSEPGYHVWVGRENVGDDALSLPAGGRDVIKIAPAIAGAKKNGALQTILGVTLIVAGLVATALGFPTAGAFMVKVGAVLALGGVAQMLTPTPKTSTGSTADNKASYVFSGAVNTSAQGSAVPVLYGEMIVGSAVISAGIYTEELAV